MHNTTALSTVNRQKFPEILWYDYGDSTMMHCMHICENLQLEETIHQAHSLEGLNVHVSHLCALDLALSSCHSFQIIADVWQFREWCLISHLHFLFLALVDKTIHLLVFLVDSIIFGFCVISFAEFQSCLLTPFQGVVLVLKPYIIP